MVPTKYSIIRVVFEFPPIMGGSVTHIVELATAINPYLERQIVVAPRFANCSHVDESFPFSVLRVPFPHLLSFGDFIIPSPVLFAYSLRAAERIKEIVNSGQEISLIHVHGPMLGSFLRFCLNLFGIHLPILVMEHGFGAERSPGHAVSSIITRSLLQRLFPPQFELILDDGTDIRNIMNNLEKKGIQYQVVNHGIDADFFSPACSEIADAPFTILFPHRIENVKRLDLALEIFARLVNQTGVDKVRLVILCDRNEIERQVKSAGLSYENVICVGKQSTPGVRDYLRKSDVVIGTSLESNMNRAIQEAMACAKPVIAFDSGGTSRLIKDNENGILIRPGDVAGFADALRRLYSDSQLRATLGQHAMKTIVKERNWHTRICLELGAYERVVDA